MRSDFSFNVNGLPPAADPPRQDGNRGWPSGRSQDPAVTSGRKLLQTFIKITFSVVQMMNAGKLSTSTGRIRFHAHFRICPPRHYAIAVQGQMPTDALATSRLLAGTLQRARPDKMPCVTVREAGSTGP